MDYTLTSESVCAGHPDKICDQVSDAIVDAVLTKDPFGRVAVETLVTENRIVLAGEVRTNASIDFEKIARKVIKQLGYTKKKFHFTHLSPLDIYIHQQSAEIALGVDDDGAGDQGMMYGYASQETSEFMPMPIMLAHKLAQNIDTARESQRIPYLRPDGKTQVTVLYKNGKPSTITSLVLATPHDEKVETSTVIQDLLQHIVLPVIETYHLTFNAKDIIVNGTGLWHIGGPASDTGVTGRKIIVDTYGSAARVGGGAFSGKDPTKVDRSGAYAARFIAKNIVAHKLADKVEVRLAYAIGRKKPLMQDIETFGTAHTSEQAIKDFSEKLIDTSVTGIINTLQLRNPLYQQTAAYGHFGRDIFPWETLVG